MSWTRKKPIPPPKGTGSDWYWYLAEGEKEPWVVEIYHGCWQLYTTGGYWWPEPVPKPSAALPRKKAEKEAEIKSILNSMTEAEAKAPRNYRGRGIL